MWPAQLLLYAIALLAISLALQCRENLSRSINFILSLLWLWMGIVYHLLFFSAINKAAYAFGAFFILQALAFIFAGVTKPKLLFRFRPDFYGIAGAIFFLYALIIYQASGKVEDRKGEIGRVLKFVSSTIYSGGRQVCSG